MMDTYKTERQDGQVGGWMDGGVEGRQTDRGRLGGREGWET